MTRPPCRSTLFPYTPLFRSSRDRGPRNAVRSRDDRRRDGDGPAAEIRSRGRGHCARVVGLKPGGGRRMDDLVKELSKKDRKSTRLNSSHGYISYAVLCFQKK